MLKNNQDPKTHNEDLQKHQEQSEASGLLMKTTVHKERSKILCHTVFHAAEVKA